MPDFNKGDFTQQGVAGHVNANLRLNEKRLVNIDLTSNEEAEGCTITGTVKDLLNDKVYGIGAGVSGNIEITENGENINVAQYATATVNVSGGEGDFSTATVTITNTTEENYHVPIPQVTERQGMKPAMIQSGVNVKTGTSATIAVPLYHGACYATVYDGSFSFASCTGNIEIRDGTQLFIRGDGTLTI